jgi:hypothetical protein
MHKRHLRTPTYSKIKDTIESQITELDMTL